jgi:hypothetical protein
LSLRLPGQAPIPERGDLGVQAGAFWDTSLSEILLSAPIALAIVLGAAEHGVCDVHTWQSAEGSYWASHGVPLAARNLAWFAAHTAYSLSSIEAEVAAHTTGQPLAEPSVDRPDGDGEDLGQASADAS